MQMSGANNMIKRNLKKINRISDQGIIYEKEKRCQRNHKTFKGTRCSDRLITHMLRRVKTCSSI